MEESKVNPIQQVLLHKNSFITKNAKPIGEVYKMDKKTLGSGTFGVVRKVKHIETGQKRACKVIARKKIKNLERFKAEVQILQKVDHPYILKLYEYFEDEKNFYLVTELCKGGELFDKIVEKEHYEEKEAAKVFKQIMTAINYCHEQNIAHRDLKPENFLFDTKEDNSDIKVIDFGLSKICYTRNVGKIERM